MNVAGSTSVSFSSAGIALDPEGRVAVLVLEQQQTQEDAAREDKALARQRFVEASNQEVESMRDKAGDIWKGAFVQGAATLTASTIQVRDALTPGRDLMEEAKAAAASSAAPLLGKFFGDVPAAEEDANAKHASALAEQARWQLDDANQVIDKAETAQDKTLDWASSVNANQASAETGIIAGFA